MGYGTPSLTRQQGFSLTEAAIGLTVAALVATGIFMMTGLHYQNSHYEESQQRLNQVRKALLDFVRVNKYLPCPDSDGDGHENRRSDKSCMTADGQPPFLDLNLTRAQITDSWNQPFLYAVNRKVTAYAKISDPAYSASFFFSEGAPIYTDQTPPTATTTDPDASNLTVTDGSAPVVDRLPVVLVAYNRNGSLPCSQRPVDEQENCDGDQTFIRHELRQQPFFDDQIAVISRYDILEAQQMPSLTGIPPLDEGQFRSQFSPEHTNLYRQIVSLIDARPQFYERLHPTLQRLIEEDERLYDAETRAMNESACRLPPDDITFTLHGGNLEDPVNLGQNGIGDHLRIGGDTLPSAHIYGNDADNTVFVEQRHLSTLALEAGQDRVIVGQTGAGVIETHGGDDEIRICGPLTTVEYTLPPTTAYTRFYFNDRRQLSETIWRFTGVADDIDAVVELVDHTPGYDPATYLFSIDYQDSGIANALQVAMRIPEGLPPNDYWFEFRITFIDDSTPDSAILSGAHLSPPYARAIPAFTASAVDIDGYLPPGGDEDDYSRQYEYVELSDFTAYWLETPTRLNVTETSGRVRAHPLDDWFSPQLTIEETRNMMTADFRNVASFRYRAGVRVEETVHPRWIRLHSLYFDEVEYDDAQVIRVTGYVDSGDGDDTVMVREQADLNISVGGGDNLAYLFDAVSASLDGGNGPDLFATLGTLDAGADDYALWAAGHGDNSIRIKGDCYESLEVGSGNDLLIFSQDVDGGCSFDTGDGHDTVLLHLGTAQVDFRTGEGQDLLALSGQIGATVRLETGEDMVVATTPLTGTIEMGPDDDYALIPGLAAGAVLDGGGGFDTVQITDPALSADDWPLLQSRLPRIEKVQFADGTTVYPCETELYSLCP